MGTPRIDLPMEEIAAFCHKWRIGEFALFGSVLRDDFGPDSDVDVLVTFAPDADWGLFEFVDMRDELASVLHRQVDLVERDAVAHARNPFRKREIPSTYEVVSVAA